MENEQKSNIDVRSMEGVGLEGVGVEGLGRARIHSCSLTL